MYFVVATIMGLFASKAMPPLLRIDAMNFFNYTTITSFFDSASMLDGTLMFLWKLAVLFGIGLSGFIIGMLRFNKKDLPL